MAGYYPPKKSPLLAALLGAILPGLGHIYNEQIGKGVVICSLLLGTVAMIVLTVTGTLFFMTSLLPGLDGGLHFYEQPTLVSKFIVLVAICVFLPVIWLYSIADAYATSTKINRGEIPLGGYPIIPPAPPMQTQSTHPQQEARPMETPPQTGATSAGGSFSHPHTQSAQPSASDTARANDNHPSENSSPDSNHGRLVLGILLVALGFFFMADDMNIHYLRFEKLWPLIPLFFGLRLLREYQLEGSPSQKVLGIVFTLFGGIFLLHNWTRVDVLELIGEYWYGIPLTIGFILLLIEFREKHWRKNNPAKKDPS